MKISGLTEAELAFCFARVNARYGSNLLLHAKPDGDKLQARLGVRDPKGPGASLGLTGRPLPVPCWHAWRDFLGELFSLGGDVLVETAVGWLQPADMEKIVQPAGDTAVGLAGERLRERCQCES